MLTGARRSQITDSGYKTFTLILIIAVSVLVSSCSKKEEKEDIEFRYRHNLELHAEKFEECVSNAESKHAEAVLAMCKANLTYKGSTSCSYPIASKETLDRSKDNEINACAVMYSPNK